MKSFGMPMVYFILTGTIASELLGKIDGIPHILTQRWIYVVITGVLLLFFALKKDITDLKPIAFFLFIGVLLFVVLLAVHMIFEQKKTWNNDTHPHKEYFIPFNEDKNKLRLIYMVMTILVSVSFQTVFFPVLNNLKDNSKTHMMKTSVSALSTAAIIYTGVTLISIYAFGHGVQSDILKNVVQNNGWETIVLGVLFAIVGSLHIPLIFFVAKEAMLIIIFTYFYTEQEKEEVVIEGDHSHLEDVSGISKLVPKSMLEHGDGQSAQPTRSELNRTGISVLRKTSVIPNIDVSITKQVLAVNNLMLRHDGMKGYEKELKEQEGAAKEPSHRDLPLWLYLTVTITIYSLDIALASILDDVSIIFGFVGALSISMLFFILPGWFYLRAVALANENGSIIRRIIAWTYIIFGICLAIGGLASVTVKIVGDKNKDPIPDPE